MSAGAESVGEDDLAVEVGDVAPRCAGVPGELGRRTRRSNQQETPGGRARKSAEIAVCWVSGVNSKPKYAKPQEARPPERVRADDGNRIMQDGAGRCSVRAEPPEGDVDAQVP